jgi:polycomb protein EED
MSVPCETITHIAERQEILSIVFHPLHPHILASSSTDRTIRIWNIYGTDVEREEGDDEPLSENFPQGDADEGHCVLAILAGDKAGHKAGVTALVRPPPIPHIKILMVGISPLS